jgi:CRP-like cAMP-binding protein
MDLGIWISVNTTVMSKRDSRTAVLSALPRKQLDLLAPYLTTKELAQGIVLLETGEEFDRVYFPHSGMLSLLVVMLRDGKAIEVATVGREGVVGAMAGLGLYRSSVRVSSNCRWPSRR